VKMAPQSTSPRLHDSRGRGTCRSSNVVFERAKPLFEGTLDIEVCRQDMQGEQNQSQELSREV
jgi:hypothetical protein